MTRIKTYSVKIWMREGRSDLGGRGMKSAREWSIPWKRPGTPGKIQRFPFNLTTG
jgi:hypothetical protein